MTKEEIKDALVAEYGPKVLAEPRPARRALARPRAAGRARAVVAVALTVRRWRGAPATRRADGARARRGGRAPPRARHGRLRPVIARRQRRHDRLRRLRRRLRLLHLALRPAARARLPERRLRRHRSTDFQEGEGAAEGPPPRRDLLPRLHGRVRRAGDDRDRASARRSTTTAARSSTVAGALIIVLGVFFVLTPFVPRLNREWRVDALMQRAGSRRPADRRRGVRDRLDAVRRPDARLDPHRRGDAGDRRPRAACCWPPTAPASPSRSCVTAVAFNRATTAFRWLRDHYLRRHRDLRRDPDRHGRPAAHRRAHDLNTEAQRLLRQARARRPLQPLGAEAYIVRRARRPRAGRASGR